MSETDTTTPAPEVAPEAPEEPKPTEQQGNVEELPAWAREALTRANREAAGYRTKVRELEPLAQEAQKLKDAQKTETERLTERLTVAEQRALDAIRYEVALDKGLTRSQAKRLVGTNKEEFEADADELLADLGSSTKAPRVPGRPKEQLRGGGDPDQEPEEDDPEKLAAKVRRGY